LEGVLFGPAIAAGMREKAGEFVISRTVRMLSFARFFMRGLGA
jgi:hypothetical protein